MPGPFENIMASLMRGNAESQAQAQVKTAVSDQVDSKRKMSVTMKANPNGGPPLVTVKDAPADLLNQTQQEDLQKTYEAPHQNVEDAISQMTGAPTTFHLTNRPAPQLHAITDALGTAPAQVGTAPTVQAPSPTPTAPTPELEGSYAIVDRNVGYRVPRPWDPDIRTKLGSAAGVADLNRELGGTPARAREVWHKLQKGDYTIEEVARKISAARFAKLNKFAAEVKPALDEEQQRRALASSAEAHRLTANRQRLDTRDKLVDQANTMQAGTVADFLDTFRAGMKEVGGATSDDEKYALAAYRGNRATFMNTRAAALRGQEGRTVIEQYAPDEAERFIAEQFQTDPATMSEFTKARATKLFNSLQKANVEERMTTARKEPALGTFATAKEAADALGLGDKMNPQQQAEWNANHKVARKAYVIADARQQRALDLQAQQLQIAARSNQIMAAAQQGSGEAAIASMPDGVKAIVKGISEGRLDITKVTSMRGGGREAMAQLVASYDPTWSTAVAPARAATYRDYYAGTVKKNAIDPLNTAIHHLDAAKDSAQLLKNAPVDVWNKIKRYGLESIAGDPRYGRFVADVSLLSGEIGKISKGGVPDKTELETVNALLAATNSPERIDAALDEYVKLMAGRAIPLAEGFTTRAGTAPPAGLILTKSSEKILRDRGYGAIADEITGVSNAPAPAPSGNVVRDPAAVLKLFGKKP